MERALIDERTVVAERAAGPERTVLAERAAVVERPASNERALTAERTEAVERAHRPPFIDSIIWSSFWGRGAGAESVLQTGDAGSTPDVSTMRPVRDDLRATLPR